MRSFIKVIRRIFSSAPSTSTLQEVSNNPSQIHIENAKMTISVFNAFTSSMVSSSTNSSEVSGCKSTDSTSRSTHQPNTCGHFGRRRPCRRRQLFFFGRYKRQNHDYVCNVCGTCYDFNSVTPESSRSVSFEESDSWPFIDDDEFVSNDRDSGYNEDIH